MSLIEDPLPAYRFVVTLDPTDAYLPPLTSALITLVALGQFKEARGLGADLEVMAYAEGGRNDYDTKAHNHHVGLKDRDGTRVDKSGAKLSI